MRKSIGKTTTMRAIFGVTALDAGEIRWRGQPVGEAARRTFGYMPEERGLYPAMPLFDQVEYFARLHGMDGPAAEKAAWHWIERLGLSGRGRTRVDALSHGNQQRAQLAVALVHEPELLVLDEPFSGLDPGGIDDMSTVLKERAAAGVTVLFSSHQLDLVEDICEAVAIIYRGRLVGSGLVADLRRGDRPRLAVRVAGDKAATWSAGISAADGTVDAVRTDGTAEISLTASGDAQQILDLARAAGPVEHYTVIYANGASTFYHVLGFLPPTAPIAMTVLYASGDVPLWQVVVAMALTAVGTVWMARIAVKIYTNSILRTGPRISIRQAIRETRRA